MYWSYKPYVSIADRRANASTQMDKLRNAGKVITPIEPFKGRKIASTFWGQAWCTHIECLSDFESRLARGKTYVRNGSVCHLEIKPGLIEAKVCGSAIYEITIKIDPLPSTQWEAIKAKCAGQIGSVVELLQGKFSDSVMTILTDPNEGMFPDADDFGLDCDCPDFARLCKHLAAVLYGVGVRLDTQPELLFVLRGVDHFELIKDAATRVEAPADATEPTIAEADLSDVFGIDLALDAAPPAAKPARSVKKSAKKSVKPTKAAKRRPGNKPRAR